jgi:hypothetical protein
LKTGLILGVGSVVCLMIWMTICRTHVKHHWIMQRELYLTEGHPAKTVNDAMDEKGWRSGFSLSYWIGIVIPLFCSPILGSESVLVLIGVVKIS